ncbi:MAG: hypothetical protein HY200_01840 [Nitrospirae bacterium]|nr:hypothetical protein [Nitrospirota bacterium]MBI3593677.1 hypothetical protein [Nitrospirota bacterium]
MEALIKKEVERIILVIMNLNDDIEMACDTYSSLNQVDDIKAQAHEVLSKYNNLLSKASPEEKNDLTRGVGTKIAELEEHLSRLKEAPE